MRMTKRITILSVVVMIVCTFLSGCRTDGEYSRIRKLRNVADKAVRVGALEEASTENTEDNRNMAAESTSLQPEATVPEEPKTTVPEEQEADWFWLEAGDDDSRFRPDGQAPFYEFCEPETGEPVLTLYYDRETKSGSGVSYGYDVDRSSRVGFSFCKSKQAKEAYRVPELFTYNGVPIEEDDYALTDIQNSAEYDENGNITTYSYAGKLYNDSDWAFGKNEGEDSLIKCEIRYSYRENGTLYKKQGRADGRDYNIIGDYVTCYFDELGREVCSFEYITHGELQKYYIYEGDAIQPTYCFVFDSGWDAYMLEY